MEELLEEKKNLLKRLKKVEEEIEIFKIKQKKSCEHRTVYQYMLINNCNNYNIYQCKKCRIDLKEEEIEDEDLYNIKIIKRKLY